MIVTIGRRHGSVRRISERTGMLPEEAGREICLQDRQRARLR